MTTPSYKKESNSSRLEIPSQYLPFGKGFLMLSLSILSLAVLLSLGPKYGRTQTYSLSNLPPQSVFIDPKSFVVLPQNEPFRSSPLYPPFFNPTNSSPPFFQVFDAEFLDILGDQPSIAEVASNDTYAFAHEAPVYVPETDDLWFCANAGGYLGHSDRDHNSMVGKISMGEVNSALGSSNGSAVNVEVTMIQRDELQMTNGGTGPYHGDVLFITSGRGDDFPPSIVRMNPNPPYNATVILNNYYGRQFNSLNDIKIHPSGKIFFTDTIYGSINRFRPGPLLPSQVYLLDPSTGIIRLVADGFQRSNGVAFSQDGKTAYVTDTGIGGGPATNPSTIYAFDVSPTTHSFTNRRVFTFVDAGVPDGIQIDEHGNVYSACGDGVHVWNSQGKLLGKFFLNTTSANMAFAGKGTLVILAETKIFVAKVAANGINLQY